MRILVVYASKYGATKGIAERIVQTLNRSGHDALLAPAKNPGDLAGYDAFVIGSAAYMFSWLKEAGDFVRRNADLLKTKPVWLFSSGPIGTARVDEQGRDVLESTQPKEFAEFHELIQPRGTRVFFGAFDHTRLTPVHKLVYAMPAMKKVMVDGDYRDWDDIESWARAIASALVPSVAAAVRE